ncbi:B-box type zinc finger family protein [Striga hermonthica]|uniref:B-box type zinc finger family protein n=1 Tax=Striga hermonthica TaxID=68872 RepID=A0A9N7RN37_STRHE|nr:B-box type zinc finger family protein [Striga hermonthica]
MKSCELCKRPARTHCPADQASLCWPCDAAVHSANFLVARHSRTLLCRVCQGPTPWSASGSELGPISAVCEMCVDRRSGGGNGGGGSPSSDEVEQAVVEEIQVVPWSPPPAESSSSAEETEVSGKRRRTGGSSGNFRSNEDKSSSSTLNTLTPPPAAAWRNAGSDRVGTCGSPRGRAFWSR